MGADGARVQGAGFWGRAVVAAALCGLLVEYPLLAEAAVRVDGASASESAVPAGGQIQGEARVLHALNRFTFGPRPGDVAAVQAMGLSKWFERQLDPGSIQDEGLEARLAQYPAMKLPIGELEARYPGPQMLRQMASGKVPLPDDPARRAVVKDQLAFYAMAQERAGKLTAAEAARAMQGEAPSRRAKQSAAGAPMIGQETAEPAANSAAAGLETAAMAGQPVLVKLTPEELDRVLTLAPAERFQATLAMEPMELVKFRASLSQQQLAEWAEGMTPEQRETLASLGSGVRMVAQETMAVRLERDIFSERQLEAVMTDFWLNHFNVFAGKNQVEPYLLASYERETIRPRALGRFEDLLVATAQSPAMLTYLDNAKSVGPQSMAAHRSARSSGAAAGAATVPVGLNENYGREVMELHTLGVNGGYTQADVTNVAKVFTGWTLDKPYAGSTYAFNERRHEPGDKRVLGRTIHEGGEREGLEVLHMLATSPATARFIATKLAVRFVCDDPPASLVDKMTATFLQSDGDMKQVLRTMFEAPEFWSPTVYRAKVKTPLEFVVSAARAGSVEVEQSGALVQSLAKLGMPLYGMQTPNGYSWKSEQWVSTGALVSRMNFSLVLSDDRLPGTRTAWARLLGEGAGVMPVSYKGTDTAMIKEPMIKEKRLEMLLLGEPVSERTRQTVLAQSVEGGIAAQAETQFDLSGSKGGGGKGGGRPGQNAPGVQKRQGGAPADDPQAAIMAGLLMGSPEFQRR